MAQDETTPAPKPGAGGVNVDLGPGVGVRFFPSLDAAKVAAKAAAADRSFQLQGDGPSISGALKKLLTPEAAGMAGFALGGPVGAGAAAGGTSLIRNAAQGEPLDPLAASEHVALNAAPGLLANAASRIPAALARSSGTNTGGSILRMLGEVLGGGATPTAEDLVTGKALTRRGPAIGKGEPTLSSGTHMKVGQLATDADNALAAGGLKGAEKADMVRRARQLTEAFDAIGGLRKGTGGTLPPEIAAILKANGLNPKTIQDLWAQRAALAGHGAMAGTAAAVEGSR